MPVELPDAVNLRLGNSGVPDGPDGVVMTLIVRVPAKPFRLA